MSVVSSTYSVTVIVFAAPVASSTFSGMMGGAWVNGGEGLEAKGYNKEYQPGEKLRVQFQCIDKGDGKEDDKDKKDEGGSDNGGKSENK